MQANAKLDRAALEAIAELTRRGLLLLVDKPGSTFNGFPRGTCGPASDILGRLIKEQLGADGVYVWAQDHPNLKREQSHAWFEVDGFIIDLTYDQFPDTGLTGWVFDQSNEWHAKFAEQERRQGFCPPSGWPEYPLDGYAAAKSQI